MTLNSPDTALRAAIEFDNGNALLADADVPVDVGGASSTLHQVAQDDGQPLAHCEDLQVSERAAPPPSVMRKKSNASWTVGSLGMLVLAVAVPIVQGGPLYAPTKPQAPASNAANWIELLPHDILSHVDTQVDPCDDLYAFSCGSWLKQARIPDGESRVSLTNDPMRDDNEKVLQEVMQQGWPLLGELYDSCMNFSNTSSATENAASVAFLMPAIKQIAATTSKSELFQLAGKLSITGPNFLTWLYVMADSRDATVDALHASQTGLSLPSPEYYLDPKEFASVSAAFHAYIVELFSLVGWDSHNAASQASSVIAFEQILAPLYVPEEKLQDPVATYNRMSVAQAAEEYPLLVAQVMRGMGVLEKLVAQNAYVVVTTLAYYKRVEELVTGDSVTLDTLKAMLTYQYVSAQAKFLSEPFAQASFSFLEQTLKGEKSRGPRWKVCQKQVTDTLPDLVGKYYALLRFDKDSERIANELVMQIRASVEEDLTNVDWLDGPTRQIALEKLGKMTTLIGYSNRSDHFPYKLHGDAPLAENLRIINEHVSDQTVDRIGRPVDRSNWDGSGAALDVYYQPTANLVGVPAGYFQPPNFTPGQQSVRNFGTCGSFIGHEITHHFDAEGKSYDKDGTLGNWWSNFTATEFSQRADCFVKQYSEFPVMSSEDPNKVLGHVNGELTLSENIADNGGLKLSFHAYQTYVAKQAKEPSKINEGGATSVSRSQPEPALPADVADKLFFISFAQSWCSKRSDAAIIQRLAGPRPPGQWLVNGAVKNSHDFARVFSCPVGSPMNPTTKCQVW
uniref:Endothelin-converting enzyme 1 n=1 Tax=Peronospora matthiolae TaxID=2874970 RepID=A0AAV1TL33_9STRA